MKRARILRRVALGLLAAVLASAAALIALALAVDSGHFRGAVLGFLEARTGRHFELKGAFRAHLLTMHPSFTADSVEIGNPPWMPGGLTARTAHLELTLHLPWVGRPLEIDRLAMQSAVLFLARDAKGRANWQWHDPGIHTHRGMALIHSISLPGARVYLADERRHLNFDGTVTAEDVGGPGGRLRIAGDGTLNEHPAHFEIDGDPLAGVTADRPYSFAYHEESSGSRLTGRGELPRPFHFGTLDTTFAAEGEDLKDLYFLVGISLVNTGRYQLAGSMARRGPETSFSGVRAASGDSDVEGTVRVDSSGERPKLDIRLESRLLRMADIGLRAAGRAPPSSGPRMLLSDAALNPKSMRRLDAAVTFRAHRLRLGRVDLTNVSARMSLEQGVAAVTPISADLLQGKLTGQVRIDGRSDQPRAEFDLRVTDAEIAQWPRKDGKPALVEGRLQARANGSGRGSSIHQVASTADGTLTLVLPHGAMRSSLAELAGLDLGGLGLKLAKSGQDTPVRCGAASFEAHEGALESRTLVIDTEPVLISGGGQVHLDTEMLNLELRGRPKSPRLIHLRAPLLVKGTLADPTFTVEPGHAAVQGAEAVALGVLLTPLAAILAFVDPGLAKDADCAALISGARTAESRAAPAQVSAKP